MTSHHLNASSRIMLTEAQRRGITCTTFGDNELILMEQNGKRWFTRGSRTSLQSSVGLTIAKLKSLSKKILSHYQLPTARGVEVRTENDIQLLSKLTFPLVYKPHAGQHGKGVITGINSLQEAELAFTSARQNCLFEETLQGVEYRVVCVNYQFTAAAFRKPAYVVGDGKQTIQQLITVKNQHPWRAEGHAGNLSLIKADNVMKKLLADNNLSLESVPAKDQEVLLRTTANLSTGGEAWDVSDQVSSENKELFEKIAKACDLNVIGIDIMCQSLDKPIVDQPHAGVIEVNASPGLRMHHFPVLGNPINVAGKILDMMEA